MPELRLILLVAGVLFVAAIAGYEWWRARQGRMPAGPPREEAPEADSVQVTSRSALPEINVVREPRTAVAESLPVIEIDSTSDTGTRRALGISISDDVAVDMASSSASDEEKESPQARAEPYIGDDDVELSPVRVFEEQPAPRPQLVLDWPKENERRIVALRVVPRGEPRFAGRALRQAFASAGFWYGPMDIFHLPDDNGRVLVSAAALAQPGTFDPSIMDSQRFSGLNLFSVLPATVNERDAFDGLVRAARSLSERLEASITDQHGEELTAQRIARLRQSLPPPVQARAAGEG